ncbi:hypothetical protein JQ628_01645 [Bradyrhizobium lablabi]|uniref:hypothetical protein n=1 Tax=Bradyrhizobium lablabi TaxID=722472 RepID=UPI001BAA1559|nr:hypothetical protein [Bradyrhizobium lablabi]MBR1120200.1 hypothetical protein [Bradyrhizobium lablabi]
MAYVAADGTTVNSEGAHWLVRLLLLMFVLVCIFDPADQVLRGKVPLFVALWPATLAGCALTREEPYLPPSLLIYSLAFITIPLLSIGWYHIIDGRQPFEGFALFKAYLFISFAIILVLNKIDLIPQLSAVLTLLALSVIAVFLFLQFSPEEFERLHELGINTGVLSLDRRKYGENLELVQVYFVTSAMLVVSIAYYFDRVMSAAGYIRKLAYLVLLGVNITGMLLAGTRNNILVSLLLPFTLWPLYTARVARNALLSLLVLVLLALPFADRLQAFFDAEESSNSIKLTLLRDYISLLSDPVTLLFGQGLGAYHEWSAGQVNFYITELTYLEMLRSFGIFGAAAMVALLLFPAWYSFAAPLSRRARALAVAYLFYLLMAVSNPLLFSSSGMLILSAILANVYLNRSRFEATASGERRLGVKARRQDT